MNIPSLLTLRGVVAALEGALEVGLLGALQEGPAAPESLAASLRLDEAATRAVCDVLVAAGILEPAGGGLALAPAFAHELSGPAGVPGADEAVWRHVATYLRSGRSLQEGEQIARAPSYRGVVDRLAVLFAGPASVLSDRLVPELPRDARILDVGAGSGVWSLCLANRLAAATVTGLDLPGVVDRFAANAAAHGLGARADTIAADAHDMDLGPRTWDVVVLANVLHLDPAGRASRLVAQLGRQLSPGGHFVIVDILGPGGAADLPGAAYALHLALRLPGARPHPEATLRAWLSSAGCEGTWRVDLGWLNLAALVARRATG